MKTKLIIIRGNSASGKSTIAQALRTLHPQWVVVSQDMFRRDVLNVRDNPGNIAIDLLSQVIDYCDGKCELIILEGILRKDIYHGMLSDLAKKFHSRSFFYYVDLSLDETFQRHQTRDKSKEFTSTSLTRWYIKDDRLNDFNEHLFYEHHNLEVIISKIEKDVRAAPCQERQL